MVFVDKIQGVNQLNNWIATSCNLFLQCAYIVLDFKFWKYYYRMGCGLVQIYSVTVPFLILQEILAVPTAMKVCTTLWCKCFAIIIANFLIASIYNIASYLHFSLESCTVDGHEFDHDQVFTHPSNPCKRCKCEVK